MQFTGGWILTEGCHLGMSAESYFDIEAIFFIEAKQNILMGDFSIKDVHNIEMA